MNNKFTTIGMVVAMDKEVKPFFEKFGSDVQSFKIGGYDIFSCQIANKKIYLIKSGIGEILASSATQLLISVYKCDIILNFGVCGSLTDNISVCETVVVNGVVHYDFDLSSIDGTKVGEYPNAGGCVIKTNKELLDLALKVDSSLKCVICASADKFVADESIKTKLNLDYGAEICDMESAGVLLTANMNNVPTLIIKAVSDGKGGAEEFNRRVKVASKAYIETVNKIIELV